MPSTPPVRVSNRTYDRLKPVVQIWLPALATLYSALGLIWGFPNVEEVVGSIVAITTFLGAILGLSSSNYKQHKDGTLVVNETDPMKDTYSFEVETPLEDLPKRDELRLEVRNDSQKNHGL